LQKIIKLSQKIHRDKKPEAKKVQEPVFENKPIVHQAIKLTSAPELQN
jgi:hypothetical protein